MMAARRRVGVIPEVQRGGGPLHGVQNPEAVSIPPSARSAGPEPAHRSAVAAKARYPVRCGRRRTRSVNVFTASSNLLEYNWVIPVQSVQIQIKGSLGLARISCFSLLSASSW